MFLQLFYMLLFNNPGSNNNLGRILQNLLRSIQANVQVKDF